MKRFLTKKYLILLVVLFAAFIGWRIMAARKKAAIKPPPLPVVESNLILSGELKAERAVDLQFQSSGLLSWVGVKEGDQVKKYQTLATLDQRSVKKNLEKYLNLYSKSRWDFDQAGQDNQDYQTLASDASDAVKRILEKAQFDLNNAVLDVELQDLAVQYSRLSTPIDGLVTRIDQPYAGVNILYTAITSVVDPQSLYFEVAADQTEVVKIALNESVKVTLDSFPDQTFTGRVTQIDFAPKAGETSTVYRLKVVLDDFDNTQLRYRLGMTGDVEFNH
ncbi:MAG: efflux RND transporter periplasmic adaptor subunit [Candidatus Shapirobacteria bacterium]